MSLTPEEIEITKRGTSWGGGDTWGNSPEDM